MISINFKYRNNEKENFKNLVFRDSYQILPSSLKKLADCFSVKTPKSIFPYKFVNEV
jgi:hypothetical protein